LHAAGAGEDARAAAEELAKSQRDDGGWGQTDEMASDAYATGTALFALHRAGGLAVSDPAYQRGVAFLVRTQLEDGSWLVLSRSRPFQTYFESGFPHGKDQFISMAATGWATAALSLAIPAKAAARVDER
jgi:squalene cyclase